MPKDTSATTISDVATIPCIGTSLNLRNAGTIKKPPPTPSNPVNNPAEAPIDANVVAQRRSHFKCPVVGLSWQFLCSMSSSDGQPARAFKNMRAETNTITPPNKAISAAPGSNLAKCSPSGDASQPAPAINAAAL